ncbi:MAG: sensor histidine kinase [Ignavibacteriales bacterium]|nr:sensor histidine kinase [Ignavibacteriales bacterium]
MSTSVIHDESGNPILLLGVSYDITEEKKLRKRLDEVQRQRTEDLQRFASSVQQAQEEERHRIARELHDDLGQRLSGMKLSLQVAEERMSKTRKRAPREIAGAKKQIDNMIGEIRRISANLRPTALDDFGLLIALRLLFREFEKMCNVKVNFEFASSLNEHHPPQIEIAIYRIIQEALSNVARHAAATTVTLQLGQKDGRILLLIADDGVGLKKGTSESGSPSHRGFGLLSMRERSEHLGGRFHIERDTMGGTRIQVEIPLQE